MIELQAVTFRYGAHAILRGASHTFEPGASTALVGRSGAGKSTLLYLLGLLLTPQSGRIVLDGTTVGDLSDGARSALRADSMGFLFQDALLDPARSVLDNVLQGAHYHSAEDPGRVEQAQTLLDRFGVPHDSWRRRPGQISGGQAQRVALCRALIKNPPVILADEPTGNLDRTTAEVVWSALHDAAHAGSLVITATHDPARAKTCDHVVQVRDGLLD